MCHLAKRQEFLKEGSRGGRRESPSPSAPSPSAGSGINRQQGLVQLWLLKEQGFHDPVAEAEHWLQRLLCLGQSVHSDFLRRLPWCRENTHGNEPALMGSSLRLRTTKQGSPGSDPVLPSQIWASPAPSYRPPDPGRACPPRAALVHPSPPRPN